MNRLGLGGAFQPIARHCWLAFTSRSRSLLFVQVLTDDSGPPFIEVLVLVAPAVEESVAVIGVEREQSDIPLRSQYAQAHREDGGDGGGDDAHDVQRLTFS